MIKQISIVFVLLASCQGGSRAATCDEAIDHTASLIVERAGRSLPEDQRVHHRKILARAMSTEYQANCSNDDSALIECVLEAGDPATAQSCWRKQ